MVSKLLWWSWIIDKKINFSIRKDTITIKSHKHHIRLQLIKRKQISMMMTMMKLERETERIMK